MAKKLKKKSDILLTLPEVAGVPEYSPDDSEGKEEAQQLMGGLTGSVPDVRNDFDPSQGTQFEHEYIPFNPYRIHEFDTEDQQSDESNNPTFLTESERGTSVIPEDETFDPYALHPGDSSSDVGTKPTFIKPEEHTDLKKTMGDYSDRDQNYSLFKDLMEQKISPNSYGGAEFGRSMEKAREAALADRPEVAAAFGADLQDIITPATEVAFNKGTMEGNEFQENRKNKQGLVSDVLSTANNLDQSANSNLLAGRDVERENMVNQQDLENSSKQLEIANNSFYDMKFSSDEQGNLYENGKLIPPHTGRYNTAAEMRDRIVSLQNEVNTAGTKVANTSKQANALYGLAEKQGQKADSLMKMLGIHTAARDYSGLYGTPSTRGYSMQKDVPAGGQEENVPAGDTETPKKTQWIDPKPKTTVNAWTSFDKANKATPMYDVSQNTTSDENAAANNATAKNKQTTETVTSINNLINEFNTYNTKDQIAAAAILLQKKQAQGKGNVGPTDYDHLRETLVARAIQIGNDNQFEGGQDPATGLSKVQAWLNYMKTLGLKFGDNAVDMHFMNAASPSGEFHFKKTSGGKK